MSSKSKNKPWDDGPNPYGDGSKRSRGWYLTVTVAILLIACAAWFFRYTEAIEGRAPVPPNAVNGGAATLPTPATGN